MNNQPTLTLPHPPHGIQIGRTSKRLSISFITTLLSCVIHGSVLAAGVNDALQVPTDVPLAAEFEREVTPRLQVPGAEVVGYATRLQDALAMAKVTLTSPQFVVLVDRSASVQAAFVYWGSQTQGWGIVGSTPVATGLPGRYEHFTTPLGVFEHSTTYPDFRAEGTKNKLGFRGYGVKGMRIYDFGWVAAPRGWGDGAMGELRLQIHATDPVLAEPLLGNPRSEGCVRIPATLNAFIDHHGLIDQAYEQAHNEGSNPWILAADRAPTQFSGRYLVVIDSERKERPAWSPLPAKH